jgi:hypothetical protein
VSDWSHGDVDKPDSAASQFAMTTSLLGWQADTCVGVYIKVLLCDKMKHQGRCILRLCHRRGPNIRVTRGTLDVEIQKEFRCCTSHNFETFGNRYSAKTLAGKCNLTYHIRNNGIGEAGL